MRSTKQYERVSRTLILAMVEELSSQASARLNKEIEGILLPVGPRSHHEQMSLDDGPEANRRDPYP